LLKIPIKEIKKKFDVKILYVHFAFLEKVRHKQREKRRRKKNGLPEIL